MNTVVSEILRARVDGSAMASFDGVVLGSFGCPGEGHQILECLGLAKGRVYKPGPRLISGEVLQNTKWNFAQHATQRKMHKKLA